MLPDLIEIVPLTAPVHAEITVPGSKSITNRALVLAALGGQTTLTGALWSADTQARVECLGRLGFGVSVAPDANAPAKRTPPGKGRGQTSARGGTRGEPARRGTGNGAGGGWR